MDQLLGDLSEISRAVTLFQVKVESLLGGKDVIGFSDCNDFRFDPDLDLLLRDLLKKFRTVRALIRRAEALGRTKREFVVNSEEERDFAGLGEEDLEVIGLLTPSAKEEEEEREWEDPLAGVDDDDTTIDFTDIVTPPLTVKKIRSEKKKSPVVMLQRLEEWELNDRAKTFLERNTGVVVKSCADTVFTEDKKQKRKVISHGPSSGQIDQQNSGTQEPDSKATRKLSSINLRKRKKVDLANNLVAGEDEGQQEDEDEGVRDLKSKDEDWVHSDSEYIDVDKDSVRETLNDLNSSSTVLQNIRSGLTELITCADPTCEKKLRGRKSMIIHCRRRHPSFCEKNPEKLNPKRKLPPCQFNSDGKVTCLKEDCNWVGRSRQTFITHMKTAHADFLVKQFGFSKNVDLKEKLTEKRFPCPQCNVVLSSSSSLNYHLVTHSGERPFLCSVCGHSFKAKRYLQAHMTTHSSDKLNKCEFCGKSFRWSQTLKKHYRSAHPDKIGHEGFLCNLCGANLTHKDSLKVHIRDVHEGERRFKCLQCPKAFKCKTHLKYHIRTHSNPGGRQRGLNSDRVYVPKKVTKPNLNGFSSDMEEDNQ